MHLLQVTVIVTLILAAEAAFSVARRKVAIAPQKSEHFTALEAAMLGLLGLLLAFTTAMAEQRFSQRRDLILQEANAIEATWLRSDFFQPEEAAEVRELLRKYADARIAFYDPGADKAATERQSKISQDLQHDIWHHATKLAGEPDLTFRGALFASSVNEMVDFEAARVWALETTVPVELIGLLVLLAIVAVAMSGYASGLRGGRSVLGLTLVPLLIGLAICVVLELNAPRVGFIRSGQAPMIRVREEMR
jgi:hypothetical protein